MAMNDPRWGQNNDGPPDLEELWRRFNKRIGSFGQKGNGSGGDNNSSGRLPPIGGGIVIVIALLLWAASGIYIVDASERGVVFQFGRYLETTQPGPHWHIPWPVGSKEIVNVSEVRTIEVGYRNNGRILFCGCLIELYCILSKSERDWLVLRKRSSNTGARADRLLSLPLVARVQALARPLCSLLVIGAPPSSLFEYLDVRSRRLLGPWCSLSSSWSAHGGSGLHLLTEL